MFSQIYEAALNGNIKELKKLGLNKSNINVFEDKYPYLSAAGKLAIEGKLQAVKLLTRLGADVNYIAQGFALAGNHAKVEEYRTQHGADVWYVIQGYVEANHYIPPFYNAAKILENHGLLGERLILIMARLKDGQDNNWNPYWMKSGVKLDRLIKAIERLKETDNLSDILENDNSAIYKALNLRRINPYGMFKNSNAKSLIAAKKVIEKNSEEDILMSSLQT